MDEITRAVLIIILIATLIVAFAVAMTVFYFYHRNRVQISEVRLEYLAEKVEDERKHLREQSEREHAIFKDQLQQEKELFKAMLEREREELNTRIEEEVKRGQQAVTAIMGLTTRLEKMDSDLEDQRRRNWDLSLFNDKLYRFFDEEIRKIEQTYGLKIERPTPPDIERFVLLSNMKEALGLNDVKELCFALDIDFHSLDGGENKDAKIVSLLDYAARNGRTEDIRLHLKRRRSEYQW